MFDTFLGLPLHVLLLHFTVVLIPLAAVATVAAFWWAPWRRFAGAPVAAVNVALLVLTFVTVQSGQNLQSRFQRIGDMSVPRDDHETFGRALLWIVLALAVVTLVGWLAGRRSALSRAARASLGVVVAVLAGASLVLAVLAGHTGSSSHWSDFVENTAADRS